MHHVLVWSPPKKEHLRDQIKKFVRNISHNPSPSPCVLVYTNLARVSLSWGAVEKESLFLFGSPGLGSVENILFDNVLGGINRRWKARIDWRNYINSFDMFTVSAEKGKLEKIIKSSIYLPFPQGRVNSRRYP